MSMVTPPCTYSNDQPPALPDSKRGEVQSAKEMDFDRQQQMLFEGRSDSRSDLQEKLAGLKGAKSVDSSIKSKLILAGSTFFKPLHKVSLACKEFKEQRHRLALFSPSQANHAWPELFGTSPWLSKQSVGLLVFRCVAFAVFLAFNTYSIYIDWEGGFWLIYLTHWSLILELMYFFFAACTTFAAWKNVSLLDVSHLEVVTSQIQLPWFVRTTVILNHIVLPASLLVMIVAWTAVMPFWKLHEVPSFKHLFEHGLNFFICLADLAMSWDVFSLPQTLWFLGYVSVYFAFSFMHFAMKIGTYAIFDSCKPLGYPREECPVYRVLDWHKPKNTTSLVVIMSFLVLPMVVFAIRWFAHLRPSVRYPALELSSAEWPSCAECPQEERRVLDGHGPVTFVEMRSKLSLVECSSRLSLADLQQAQFGPMNAAELLWKSLPVDKREVLGA